MGVAIAGVQLAIPATGRWLQAGVSAPPLAHSRACDGDVVQHSRGVVNTVDFTPARR